MKKVIYTKSAPTPLGPYSQAIQVGELLFISGQIGIDPQTDQLIQGSLEAETHQVMKNISALLEAANTDFPHVLKATIFLKDMNDYQQVNEVYGSYFTDDFPAREAIEVVRLPKDVNVEISVVAAIP